MNLEEAVKPIIEVVKAQLKIELNKAIDEKLLPAVKMAVEKSETKFDDVLYAAMEAPVKAELHKIVEGL